MGGKITALAKKEIRIFPVNEMGLVALAKSLAIMLRAGLTTVEALDILVEQNTGSLQQILQRMARAVRSGKTLAEAVENEKVFDKIFVGSVRIGESSGTLAENLEHVYIQMERSMVIRRNVRSAMIYPTIVISLILVVGFGIAIFVLPQMARTFASLKSELPPSTKIILAISDFSQNYGLIVYPIIFAALILLVVLLKQKFMQPYTHPVILKAPFVSLFSRDLNCAHFCRSLGTLLQNGVPIREAMILTSEALSNLVYQRNILTMCQAVESGQSLSQTLTGREHLFPKIIQSMVAVGERSSETGKMLLYLADFFEEKVDVRFKNASSFIEPALLIFVGGLVAFVAISILAPIYNITSLLSA